MESLLEKARANQKKAECLVRDIQSQHLNKIYIAGPMTGLPDYNRPSFHLADALLNKAGHVVLNPAFLPDGLSQPEYMDICCAMVRSCNGIYMLSGWKNSDGAVAEYHLAVKLGKSIFFQDEGDLIPKNNVEQLPHAGEISCLGLREYKERYEFAPFSDNLAEQLDEDIKDIAGDIINRGYALDVEIECNEYLLAVSYKMAREMLRQPISAADLPRRQRRG